MRPMTIRTVSLVFAGLTIAAGLGIAVWLGAAIADEPKPPAPPEMRPAASAEDGRSKKRCEVLLPWPTATGDRRVDWNGWPQGVWIRDVSLRLAGDWQPILSGVNGKEFSTSLGDANAAQFEELKWDATGAVLRLSCRQPSWEAEERIEMAPHRHLAAATDVSFPQALRAVVHPGFCVQAQSDLRYTYPIVISTSSRWPEPGRWAGRWIGPTAASRTCSASRRIGPCRCRCTSGTTGGTSPSTAWTRACRRARSISRRPRADGLARLRVYYPDSFPETIPGTTKFAAGSTLTLTEVIAAKPLAAGDDPLLEAERMAASILLRTPPHPADLKAVAGGHRGLLQALRIVGAQRPGTGARVVPQRVAAHRTRGCRENRSGRRQFDFGWGEGEAVYFWAGAVGPLEAHRRREPVAATWTR